MAASSFFSAVSFGGVVVLGLSFTDDKLNDSGLDSIARSYQYTSIYS